MKTIRSQRPVKGGREKLSPTILKATAREVERQARKFGVSRSFVIAVALADQFGIDDQEQYVQSTTKHWKKPLKIVRTA
jgi:hypothetical protein